MFHSEEILLLLKLLSRDVVVEPSEAFPFYVSTREHSGYKDGSIGRLQAKLSIMLEAAHVREAHARKG